MDCVQAFAVDFKVERSMLASRPSEIFYATNDLNSHFSPYSELFTNGISSVKELCDCDKQQKSLDC